MSHRPAMFSDAPAPGAAAFVGSSRPKKPLRVALIAITKNTFETIPQSYQATMLLKLLEQCVVPAEQRLRSHFGGSGSDMPPAALMKLEVNSPGCNTFILRPLTTKFSMLARSLRVLKISGNDYDEKISLGAFAALATNLKELTFTSCGLTSVEGLSGCCEDLRKVNLFRCADLTNIDALSNRANLEEFTATQTRIACIEALRSCPNLTTLHLRGCTQLFSIEALADHQQLQEVDASCTGITSIEPLRSCPALTKVKLRFCQDLSSMEALEGHQWLQEVDASDTGITSIEPLHSCPNLVMANLSGCLQLASIEALADHQRLQEVNVSHTAITSIEPLRSCPNMVKVVLRGCRQLPADVRLPASVTVLRS